VARFTVGETLADAVDIINFSAPQSTSPFHTVGSIGFDKNKNMWMLHGEFYDQNNAQDLNNPLGKLLRFVPSRTPGMGGNTPAAGKPIHGHARSQPAGLRLRTALSLARVSRLARTLPVWRRRAGNGRGS
jgi:hypothetical protein